MSKLEDSISVLAADAAAHPERVGEYLDFLVTIGRVAQEATPAQKLEIRRHAMRHNPLPREATVFMKTVMDWR